MSPVRRAMGRDPLDLLVPVLPDERAAATAAAPLVADNEPLPPEPHIPAKTRATFHLPLDLLDQLRDCVVHLSGPPTRLTLAELAERALRRELERMKALHNDGEAFPHRDGELRGGRPVGR